MSTPAPSPAEAERFTWRDFWNRDNSIYVSERHKTLHYREIAADIAALSPHRFAHILDHGCGEALSADRVAAAGIAPMSMEEINAEVKAARAERRQRAGGH